jgi:hypothetical protein
MTEAAAQPEIVLGSTVIAVRRSPVSIRRVSRSDAEPPLAERGAREAVTLNGLAQSRVYSLCLGQINPGHLQVGHLVLERAYLPGVILDRLGVLGEAGYRKRGQDVARDGDGQQPERQVPRH